MKIHLQKQRIFQDIRKAPVRFFAVFFAVFFPSFIVAAILGAPLVPSATAQAPAPAVSVVPSSEGESPVRIVIASVGIDATIANPSSTDNAILDSALLNGAVRYPTSGLLGGNTNMLVFGHSSFLPQVRNSAYRTFNHLEKTKVGATIDIYGKNKVYHYRIVSVATAEADAVGVEFESQSHKLILATCDSFSSKNDRFVVTADFVGSEAKK